MFLLSLRSEHPRAPSLFRNPIHGTFYPNQTREDEANELRAHGYEISGYMKTQSILVSLDLFINSIDKRNGKLERNIFMVQVFVGPLGR